MSRMDVNGIRLNVEVAGSGPPVLALHGFTGDLSTWESLVEEAQREFTIVRVDLPGHGASDSPDDPERYRMEQVADDLVAVLDRLGIQRACWLGYSMGGRTALFTVTRFPERCAALVLESASPGIGDPQGRSERQEQDQRLARFIEERGIEAFVDHWERQPLFATHSRLPEETRRALREQRLSNDPHGLANSLRGAGAGAQPPVDEHLPRLIMPVLCIVGEEEAKFRPIGEEMCQHLPNSRLAVMKGVGHTPHLERPQQFNGVVLSFLRRLGVWEPPTTAAMWRQSG